MSQLCAFVMGLFMGVIITLLTACVTVSIIENRNREGDRG
jgi:hypothetical protein